jgi:GNAT superfamily N-acetyltransferase
VSASIVTRSTTDAVRFGTIVADLVAADPIGYSVLSSNLARVIDSPGAGGALWFWAESTADGTVVAAGLHTPPLSPFVVADEQIGGLFADHLDGLDRPTATVDGVVGNRSGTSGFAARWAALHPCRVVTAMQTGVYELGQLAPTRPVVGTARRASRADEALVQEWSRLFCLEIGAPPAEESAVRYRLDTGRFWLWEVATGTVSCAFSTPPADGVTRIGWVYTPPEQRGHGYGSAVTAHVSAEGRREGARCMLHTDLANPTSNGIYLALGYRRVGTDAALRFEAAHETP